MKGRNPCPSVPSFLAMLGVVIGLLLLGSKMSQWTRFVALFTMRRKVKVEDEEDDEMLRVVASQA